MDRAAARLIFVLAALFLFAGCRKASIEPMPLYVFRGDSIAVYFEGVPYLLTEIKGGDSLVRVREVCRCEKQTATLLETMRSK